MFAFLFLLCYTVWERCWFEKTLFFQTGFVPFVPEEARISSATKTAQFPALIKEGVLL